MRRLTNGWLVFVVTAVVHAAATGGRLAMSPDSQLYVRLADGGVAAMLRLHPLIWTKGLYVALLAAARALTPAHWMAIMIAVNVISSGVVAVLLVDLVQRASRSAAAPLVALLFYLACYEVIQWMCFVLTDPLFCAASFVPFYLLARRILIKGEPRRPLLLAIFVLLAAFIRPPGIVLVPLVIFGELVLVERRITPRAAAAIIAVTMAALFFVRTAVMDDPARWPFAFGKSKIVQFSAIEKRGEVVDGRRETFRPPVRSAFDHAVIVADRFVRFFQVTTSGFSRAHNLVNAVYFAPLYALGAIAVVRRRDAFVAALLVWIGTFALFYALTVLDFDWRYRGPLMPHFIALAAVGVDVLAGRSSPGGAGRSR
jgi:hypothetical protein